jgi:threonyl-tRNA synthetase
MIRDAQVEGFNYIAVIGKDEVEHQYVDLRDGEKSEQLGKYAIYKLLDLFKSLSPPKSKRRIEMENKAAKV